MKHELWPLRACRVLCVQAAGDTRQEKGLRALPARSRKWQALSTALCRGQGGWLPNFSEASRRQKLGRSLKLEDTSITRNRKKTKALLFSESDSDLWTRSRASRCGGARHEPGPLCSSRVTSRPATIPCHASTWRSSRGSPSLLSPSPCTADGSSASEFVWPLEASKMRPYRRTHPLSRRSADPRRPISRCGAIGRDGVLESPCELASCILGERTQRSPRAPRSAPYDHYPVPYFIGVAARKLCEDQ